MTDKYAVVGNPVAHSVSPRIHAAFARATGQALEYGKLAVERADFKTAVLAFRDAGGKGLNVTLPFKHEAWLLAQVRAGYALHAHAVNTIAFQDTKIIGHNTDGTGLVADLEKNLGRSIAGQRVLVMGAGGAAYGVIQPLLDRHPQQIVVANRTPEKARGLIAHFAQHANLAQGGIATRPYAELRGARFDLVINATSAGLDDAMPALPPAIFAAGALAYDVVYGKTTPFMKFAHLHGAACVADGLGMLVEQAAESFYIWRGVRPATAPVIAMLRAGESL
jgi:shikimate dehydrogenase